MDDSFSGLDGSTRRFLGGILRRSVAGGDVSPNSGNATATGILNDWQAAQNAPYGSIAYRNDPNRYGSIASRMAPGLFGPSGSLNPEYRQEQADYQRGIQQGAEQRRQVGAQDDYMRRQAAYTAQALQSFLPSSSAPRGISRIDVSSPFSSPREDDEDSYVNPY
jgi:hypothetical protein